MSAVLDKETDAKSKRLLLVVSICFGLSFVLRPYLAEELIHGQPSLYQQFHQESQR